jgi:hypothetical protein
MRIIRESYSPDVLEDLVSSYRDFYSPEEHRSIWKEIIHDYHDEELANDVLAALEDEYDQYGPGYMREGVDKKYYVKINGQYLKGKNKFSKKPVYFETDEEPTQIINQMKKDGTLSKNAKPKVKSIKEQFGDDPEDDFDYDGEMEDGFDPNVNGIEDEQEWMWDEEYENDIADTGIPVYKRGLRGDSNTLSDEYLDMIATDDDEEIVRTPFRKRFVSRQVKEDILSKSNRDYIHNISNMSSVEYMRISKEFLDAIEAPEELKEKFESFKSKYGKYPQFAYNSKFRSTKEKTSVSFQKTINGNHCATFFTEEDIETLVNCWVDTYNSIKEYEDSKSNVEKVVENVCDFVKDNKLAIGCAIFGVAALAGVIPAIVNKYKSEADIREAVSYFMNSVDWDENDRDKTIATTHTSFDSDGKMHTTTRARTLSGNKNTSKAIFTAVARYAKKNGITVRDAFHKLDGQKTKTLFGNITDEDFYKFDIVKDNNGILTINVWNDAGRKPKTFEIDTNSYQRIGDVQYSWNESKKRSGRVKESKVVSDGANEYQFEKKLMQFFDDYLAMPIVKAKAIRGDKPKPFTYLEHDENGSYFYEVCLFGEYEDDVIIELHSALIGGGCVYRLLAGDGSNCEYWMGMSLAEFEKDLDECFKVALSHRNKKVTESKKLKEFRPSKFRYDLDKQVSNKERWNLKMDIESLKKKLTDLQNTTSELPDEYVSDLCDTDSYPFDDDIDNETSLGDWCNEVDDFLTNALQLEDKGQWI